MCSQGLLRGWTAWHGQWEEAVRQKRMLAAAGARLSRPVLAAAVSHWQSDWTVQRIREERKKRLAAMSASELQVERPTNASRRVPYLTTHVKFHGRRSVCKPT